MLDEDRIIIEDLKLLLSTEYGINELETSGSEFGLNIKSTNKNRRNLLDFGAITTDQLVSDKYVPLGYEVSEPSDHLLVSAPFTLNIRAKAKIPISSLRIKKCIKIPRENKGGPDFYVKRSIDDDFEIFDEPLDVDKPNSLSIVIRIHKDYTGYIGGWLILAIEIGSKLSSTCRASYLCYRAVRIAGAILPKEEIFLSAEAKPFLPLHLKQYFERSSININEISHLNATNEWFKIKFPESYYYPYPKAPNNFQTVVNGLKDKYFPPISIAHRYLSFQSTSDENIRSNIKASFNICDNESDRLAYLYKLAIIQFTEEIQMAEDIKSYDMFNVELGKAFRLVPNHPKKFSAKFKVTGSSENRPSLMIGDSVLIRPSKEFCFSSPNIEVEGVINKYVLASEEVICQFPAIRCKELKTATITDEECLQTFQSYRFHIRFTFERTGLALSHKALEIVINTPFLQKSIFPSLNNEKQSQEPLDPIDLLISGLKKSDIQVELVQNFLASMDIDCNIEQKSAISSIIHLLKVSDTSSLYSDPGLFPPYIIFGPPGTGKTLTLVYTVVSLMKLCPNKRILITAPSDAAADVICRRLKQFSSPDKLFRLNWWQRPVTWVPIDLISYCHQENDSFFDIPTKSELENFQVIVSTCGTSGCLRDCCDLFDVVLIDESSQAVEIEVLVPISLCKPFGLVVLAGDPEQLYTPHRSAFSKCYSRYRSLQERLLSNPFYQDVKQQHGTVHTESKNKFSFGTFLRRNYRSHRDIFEVSSRLFYSDALIQSGDEAVLNSLIPWKSNTLTRFEGPSPLPPPATTTLDSSATDPPVGCGSSAIRFVGVNGNHTHELDSPSYFNLFEIIAVVNLCKELISGEEYQVTQKDIGIIAAFRSQILKIRLKLREVGLGNINVGSVQDYQGQEMKIIIISTVMTSSIKQSQEGFDSIGLLGDHRKFNVSVTRAMSLCIVVGEPYTLYADTYWSQYIEACDAKGGYMGDDCLLRKRYQATRDLQDADELLNVAAHVALRREKALGEKSGMNNFENQYFSEELIWRTLL